MLLSIIRQNQKLAAKRNPAFDRNRFAKFLIYFMVAFWAAYLIFIGVMLSFAFEDIFPSMEPYHIMNQGLIYLLILDFLLRFMLQPAMSQEIKPYLLMPIKKNKLVDTLLLQSGISSYNFFWFFLIVPFALLTIIRFYEFTGILCYLCGIWLLMAMNSYWYLICKTLLNEKLLYILLPIGVYGLLAGTEFIPEGNPVSTFMMNLGEGFIEGNILAFLGVIAAILLLLLVNRKLQLHFIYNEIAKVEDTKMKHVSEYKFLDRYGDVGEYLRLELKLCFRNKTVKTQFRMGFIIMLAFSALIAFTDVYDGTGMINFICIYNFAILSIMTLGQVMSFEGNYLDGLMSRKESIYNLLRAKYYLNCIIVFIPFLIMMIPVAKGKIPFRTFECASRTWKFKRLFAYSLFCQFFHSCFYGFLIPLFKNDHCAQHQISFCFHKTCAISHFQLLCRKYENFSCSCHNSDFFQHIFHFTAIGTCIHDNCTA